jgi:nicotinate-nucleotide pyrophosphorylase (carboxylating)
MTGNSSSAAFGDFFEQCKRQALKLALEEDRFQGDITTLATIDPLRQGKAIIIAKAGGVLAGVAVAQDVFQEVDAALTMNVLCRDGDTVGPGDRILEIEGRVSSMLSGERTALNFMQRMSGIASRTRLFVQQVSHTRAGILDTRKTAPGLRYFDKDAVRIGGGVNHRFGLFDMILIKDNHIDAAGGVGVAVAMARAYCFRHGLNVKVETEVRSHEELQQACSSFPDIILLDNFSVDALRLAVQWVKQNGFGDIVLEASGNAGLHNVAEIAMTGVDFISVGELTHSVRALDLSMNIEA